MCGIAGVINLHSKEPISQHLLERMIAQLRHRGPDGFGFYRDERVGLTHARLSIIDVEGGNQPIYNEDRSICIVFNGEIFNYIELRETLEKKGHRFTTRSDTEVLVHLYEEHGVDCLSHLNGQFAFAIRDKRADRFFAARDRVGIRPLFYTCTENTLLVASEIKALFADPRVTREVDPCALDQIFTYWMTFAPRTAFKDIFELPAGHYLLVERGTIKQKKYWSLDFAPGNNGRSEAEYAEELRALLVDATRLQLRADVPVGAYLSGGLDSSVITALIKNYSSTPLRTFSVTFQDEAYDESAYQRKMVEHLKTDHSNIICSRSDIARVFPDVLWHTEKPILRTAPAPLFLLSQLVQKSGYKVVLTGEGSDEVLAGYDIFKETKVRRFIERYPDSKFRQLILKRLYPYLQHSPVRSTHYADLFFKTDAHCFPEEFYSHIPRWNTTAKTKAFFSDSLKAQLVGYDSLHELSGKLPTEYGGYDSLSKAQYLEILTLLSGYLLSSQGDRMAMAHSIEGRFPFLDHRVIEFSCKLPSNIRMNALTEKYLLKKSMKDLLPPTITRRAKQPYLAPDAKSFFSEDRLDYVEELLSERALAESGFFNPKMVALLAKKCRENEVLGFKDNMAMVGILSTQLIHQLFVKQYKTATSDNTGDFITCSSSKTG